MIDTDVLYILMSKNKNINGYICHLNNTANELKRIHNYNIIANAIILRALAAGVLLSGNLKNRKDELILKWECTGNIKSIFVKVDYEGRVVGNLGNPDLSLIEDSIIDNTVLAEPYIGFGELIVVRNTYDGRAPYNSVTLIETGEIADDISRFIKQSLQIDSAIKIGLSIDPDNNIEACGGFLLMAMPDADESDIKEIHDKFNSIESFTELLKNTGSSDFGKILDKFGLDIISKREIRYECRCNKGKILDLLVKLKPEDFTSFIQDDGKISAACEYCNKVYIFDPKEVEKVKKL